MAIFKGSECKSMVLDREKAMLQDVAGLVSGSHATVGRRFFRTVGFREVLPPIQSLPSRAPKTTYQVLPSPAIATTSHQMQRDTRPFRLGYAESSFGRCSGKFRVESFRPVQPTLTLSHQSDSVCTKGKEKVLASCTLTEAGIISPREQRDAYWRSSGCEGAWIGR